MSVLIIGAGPGMGAAIARRFAAEGMAVGLLARDAARLAALGDELRSAGHEARAYEADAGDAGSLRGALLQAMDELGDPRVVVFNAVAWPPGDLLEMAADDLLDSLRVNAVAPVVVAQTCAPRMGEGSSLLLTGGGIVFAPRAAAAALSLGKTATRTVTELLAQTLEPRGIHVATVIIAGTIAPGGPFDPDAIAERYAQLHAEPPGAWTREVTVS